ncbi:MAG: aminobenzoyl-glutamate transport protein, partial [Planctomycetota bacterium]
MSDQNPSPQSGSPKRGSVSRLLGVVEWLGNLLPHPVTLFALICIGILILSGIAGYFEWQVPDPRPEGGKGRSPDGVIRAVSLLNPEGLRRISMGLVTNFTSFAPLGTVL